MFRKPTRREFLEGLAIGGALGGCPSGSTTSWASPARAASDEPQSTDAGNELAALEADMRRRAQWQLEQTRLVVDYYRIGRQLAYPLPLTTMMIPAVPVPSIPTYPWATWLLWTLEERVNCLGWSAQWHESEQTAPAAAADLETLAKWPTYQQYAQPDLSSAHAGRILWTASTGWSWMDEQLRSNVRQACLRHVDALLPASDKLYGSFRSKQDILGRSDPHHLLHNIPLIGTIGAALTAAAAAHSATATLNTRVQSLFGAVLDLRANGYSEGVAYDGYVLDFVADWLTTLPEADRAAVLDHPNLDQYLEQSYMLGAPGAVEQVAQLSDVEPVEMPFHLSAQAKLLRLRHHPMRAWLVERCPLNALPSSALAALHDLPYRGTSSVPPSGALDAHYAAVLRSGYQADDLSVAVACSDSPANHIQSDSGSLVIGTRGNWLLADPGYQQYVKGDERNFTIGPTAHNMPLVNNHSLNRKCPRRLIQQDIDENLHHLAINLTECYPATASVTEIVRNVWLSSKNLVVVADQIEAKASPTLTYHWHGDPAAAWWFEADSALVARNDVRLWICCSHGHISGADLQRLPGSRGQLTLITTIENAPPVVWWTFVLAVDRPALQVDEAGRQIQLLDRTLRV